MSKNILIIGLLLIIFAIFYFGWGPDTKYNWEIFGTIIQIVLAVFTCASIYIAAETYHNTVTPKCKIYVNDVPVFESYNSDTVLIEIPIIIMNAGFCPFSVYDIFLQGESRYKYPLEIMDYKLPYLLNNGAAMSFVITRDAIIDANLGKNERLVVRTSYGEEIRYLDNFVSNGEAKN